MVQFVIDGNITPEGQKAIDYLEGLVNSSLDDLAKLNNMPGYAQHYHINVMATKLLTPAEWLESYRAAGAKAAYDYAVSLEEASKKDAERDDTSNKVVEALAELKLVVEAQAAEIKALKEAKPAKKAAKVEKPVVEETEEATDAESEA